MINHELSSYFLYVHPPLSIMGYVFTFLFAFLLFRGGDIRRRTVRYSCATAWLFTFLGLVTGMLWAQIAWGSYWSWDPKETLTFTLFLATSGTTFAYFEKKSKLTKLLAILSCMLAIITALSSAIVTGLHSFV